jgi:hypothetical protein
MFHVGLRRVGFAALTAGCATVATGAAASTAAAQDTRIVLGGPAAQSLAAQGVTVAAGKPAVVRRGRLTLPVASVRIVGGAGFARVGDGGSPVRGSLGPAGAGGRAAAIGGGSSLGRGSRALAGAAAAASVRAVVAHGGTLRLRAGGRTVVLSSLRVTVGSRSTLSAVVDGRRRTVATIVAGPNLRDVEPTGTYVTEAPLSLAGPAVRLLRVALHRPGLRGGRLGTIDVQASTSATPKADAPDLPGAPAAPTVTGPPTPGGATLATRPASAITITGGTVAWAPRASWLGYLQGGGAGAGATAQDGATFDGTSYTLRIHDGWFDPASGAAVVSTTGTTRFSYRSHSIDMAFSDWAYDLTGATPKAVAKVVAANGSAKLVGAREPVALVKRGATRPVVDADAHTVTWTAIPLTLSAEGVALYRAYLYDSDQGAIAVTATTG